MSSSTARRTIMAGTVLTLIASTGAAAAPAVAAPQPTHLADARKPSPQRVLQASVDQLDRAGAVGVVAAATRDGRSWSAAAGVRSTTTRVPARPTDRVRVGSITKPMVATVVMQLVDEGRLRLDTTVDQVYPGLLPGHGDITIEQLLSHRSGLPDYVLPLAKQEQAMKLTVEQSFAHRHTDRELIRLALTEKVGKPGAAFRYANTNYLVLSQLLQKRTGQSISDLLTQRVFRKAGLKGTFYAKERWMPTNFLTEYYVEGPKVVGFRQNATLFGAAGAAVSTPDDLNRFMTSLMRGELTSKRSLEQMLRPRSATPMSYGLGVYSLPDPCYAAPKGKTPKGKGGTNASTRRVYGHNGTTYGTHSASVSTRDGRRAASASLTGRFFPPSDLTKQPMPDVAVAAALKALC